MSHGLLLMEAKETESMPFNGWLSAEQRCWAAEVFLCLRCFTHASVAVHIHNISKLQYKAIVLHIMCMRSVFGNSASKIGCTTNSFGVGGMMTYFGVLAPKLDLLRTILSVAMIIGTPPEVNRIANT